MADKFVEGKRYKFSRDVYLTDPLHAMRYKSNSIFRNRVDYIAGQEVTVIDGNGMCGGYGVKVEWCEELPSAGMFEEFVYTSDGISCTGKEKAEVKWTKRINS